MLPFDRIYVVNLLRRPDRKTAFLRDFGGMFPGLRWKWFPAYDGSRFPVPCGFNGNAGVWGCLQSHRRVLEDAILDGCNSILVFEDDAVPVGGFETKLQEFTVAVPSDWDQLMIGGYHHKDPGPIKPGVVRCLQCTLTHCYAVRGKMLLELYAHLHSPQARTHVDHLIAQLHPGYRVYAPSPFLCAQGAGYSDILEKQTPEQYWTGGTIGNYVLPGGKVDSPLFRDKAGG